MLNLHKPAATVAPPLAWQGDGSRGLQLSGKVRPNVKYTLEKRRLTRRRFGRILATIPNLGINCV